MKMPRPAILAVAMFCCAGANAGASCTVFAEGSQFGSYNPLANAALDGTGSVRVTCTGGEIVPYQVSASMGNGTYQVRKLMSGSQTLDYNVYTDGTRTTIWGDGSSGTGLISGSVVATPEGATQTSTVYGRIFSGQQRASVGSYRDQLTVTVSY